MFSKALAPAAGTRPIAVVPGASGTAGSAAASCASSRPTSANQRRQQLDEHRHQRRIERAAGFVLQQADRAVAG